MCSEQTCTQRVIRNDGFGSDYVFFPLFDWISHSAASIRNMEGAGRTWSMHSLLLLLRSDSAPPSWIQLRRNHLLPLFLKICGANVELCVVLVTAIGFCLWAMECLSGFAGQFYWHLYWCGAAQTCGLLFLFRIVIIHHENGNEYFSFSGTTNVKHRKYIVWHV